MRINDAWLVELAKRCGTPLFAYNLDELSLAVRALRRSLPSASTLYYAVKANPHPGVITHLADEGMSFEVSSLRELSAVVQAVPASRLLLTGPGKRAPLLSAFLSTGGRDVSIESPEDARQVLMAWSGHPRVRLRPLLRVAMPHRSVSPAAIRMTAESSQFGHSINEVPTSIRLFARAGHSVHGLHVFCSSNVRDVSRLDEDIQARLSFVENLAAEHALPVSSLALGGGFPHAFGQPTRSELPSVGLSPRSGARLLFESGRYVVGSSGLLLTRVLDVRQRGGELFVICDAGVTSLAGFAASGRALRTPLPLRRVGGNSPTDRPATVVGPTCSTMDVLSRRGLRSEVRIGDLLVAEGVGAYGSTASMLAFAGAEGITEAAFRLNEIQYADRLCVERKELPRDDGR